jgi:hypothetical protein
MPAAQLGRASPRLGIPLRRLQSKRPVIGDDDTRPMLETMMTARFIAALTVLAAFFGIATAQSDNPPITVPKPTIADVQKVVQTISGDKAKLRAYCDIGKLQEQMKSAREKNDTKTLDSLDSKVGSLEQQIGQEYAKVIEGLAEVDPSSAEGRKFTAAFNILYKQCK